MTEVKPKKHHWFKWYPSDWRGEPTLRLVSRAARSVWIDMLGLMHESTPMGYLYINGKKPTPEMLAKVLGDDIRDLSAWLEELAAAGVYAETPDGVIYCRRMVRLAEMAEKGAKDAEKRWGPKRKAKAQSNGDATATPIADPNGVPNADPTTDPNAHMLHAISQKDLKPLKGFKSSGVANDAGRRKAPAPLAPPAEAEEPKPGWEAKFPHSWGALRTDFFESLKTDKAWENLLSDCRAVSDTELICPTIFHRDTLQRKFGEEGEKLPKHIFKAPVQFRFERPTARH